MFPVEYGPDFDTALETLVCELFTKLEELLLIPDFKQVEKTTCAIKKKNTIYKAFPEIGFLVPVHQNNTSVCLIKTAVWISDTPSVLEEYMQCVSKADDLKVLLRSKAHRGKMTKMDTRCKSVCLGYQPGCIMFILVLKPSLNELVMNSSE